VKGGEGYYHCMTRVVAGERLLGERERGVLSELIWRVGEFSGVRVLTYAVLSNHFHVLVGVSPVGELSDAELVRRYRVLCGGHGGGQWGPKPEVLEHWLEQEVPEGRLWRERLRARMGDVSAFMQTLKQRFTRWYNRTHGRFGTLWAERFKSVLVEGAARTLSTVGAYIDLNAVRAGLVEDPGQYRWCGYGEAMGGRSRAREGLKGLYGGGEWSEVVSRYRRLLFGKGAGGALGQGKIARERVVEVLRAGGRVSRAEALRCRVRYFSDAVVLGSSEFVQRWLEALAPDRRRKTPAEPHALEGSDWEGLTAARGLRREVFE
jgi:putative transposase